MPLFKTLKPKPKAIDSDVCLLLDVSGSMDGIVTTVEGTSPRRIEVLFKAVRETPECAGLKPFIFSAECEIMECIPSEADALNYRTRGSTDLALAFRTVKSAGYFSAILVTDGEPDSSIDALEAAAGMRLGIIYIGNPPTPYFLTRLAEETYGTFSIADMKSSKLISEALIKALPTPIEPEDMKGPIIL